MDMEAKRNISLGRQPYKILYSLLFSIVISSPNLFATGAENDTYFRTGECTDAISQVLKSHLADESFENVEKFLTGFIKLQEDLINKTTDFSKRSQIEKDLLSDLFIIESAVNLSFSANFSSRLFKRLRAAFRIPGKKQNNRLLVASLVELLKQGPRPILSKAIETNSNYIADAGPGQKVGFGDGKPTHKMSEAELGALSIIVEMSHDFVLRKKRRDRLSTKIYNMTAKKFFAWFDTKTTVDDQTGLGQLRKQVGKLTDLYENFKSDNPKNKNTDFRHFRAWLVKKIKLEIKERTAMRAHLYHGLTGSNFINGDIKELETALKSIQGIPTSWTQNVADFARGSARYAKSNAMMVAGIFGAGVALAWVNYGYLYIDFMPPHPETTNPTPKITVDDLAPPEKVDLTGDGKFDIEDVLIQMERISESKDDWIEREAQKERDRQKKIEEDKRNAEMSKPFNVE